jgi:anti-sigma B factor antagonist
LPDLNPPPESSTEPRPLDFACELRSSGRAATWLRAHGALDLRSAPEFEQAARRALSSAVLVIVDLRQLTFIDSTGLQVIMELDARARRSYRRLVFVRAPAPIDRLFELVGLSGRLEVIDLRPVLVSAPAPIRPIDAA